jgi:hypothetical protein
MAVFISGTTYVANPSPLAATEGGTGQSVFAVGDTLYASSTTALSKLAIGTTGQVLTVTAGLPSWVTPGSGSAPATQILYGTGASTSSSTEFIFNNTTGRLAVNPNLTLVTTPGDIEIYTRPVLSGAANAGNIYIASADAFELPGVGGLVSLNASATFDTTGATKYVGGYMQANGGLGTSDSGKITLQAGGTIFSGSPTLTNAYQGGVTIAGGVGVDTSHAGTPRVYDDVELRGSRDPSWAGEGGHVTVYTDNTLTLKVYNTGSVTTGRPSLATNASAGFPYFPTCAGTPTGTPTAITGYAPVVIDITNSRMYFYSTTTTAWVALN